MKQSKKNLTFDHRSAGSANSRENQKPTKVVARLAFSNRFSRPKTRFDRSADQDRILSEQSGWLEHRSERFTKKSKLFLNWFDRFIFFTFAKPGSQSLILASWNLLASQHAPNDQHRDRRAQSWETSGQSLVCLLAWRINKLFELLEMSAMIHCWYSP